MDNYAKFLESKTQLGGEFGFAPLWMPDFLFDFQQHLVEWSLRKGRAAIFADCGLGKTPMQLVWAENVVRKTNGRVLIVTPLAVSHQTVREGHKFGVECRRSDNGQPNGKITITNYERLHHFNTADYCGVVCDESSILKNFDGTRKAIVTEFLRMRPYRLLCTATAAPNDYIELGTTSEALGEMGFMDMLNKFFKNEQNNSSLKAKFSAFGSHTEKWRFKKHAQTPFWKWVCSWARAIRKPSDLGFDDGPFQLPPLVEKQSVVENSRPFPGEMFVRPAIGLKEQREEARATLKQRCERVSELVNGNSIAVVWCHLNDEGDLLEQIIPDSVQVSGSDSDAKKEERLQAFSNGQVRVLITKQKIAGWGLNWQHCSHMTIFPSHSFEAYYQGVRRCWRFGQEKAVTVDIVTTKGGLGVLKNLQRKSEAASVMFDELLTHMNQSLTVESYRDFTTKTRTPEWL